MTCIMHPRRSVNTLVFEHHPFFIRYHTYKISMYTLHVTWLCVVEAQRVDVSSVSLHLFLSQSSSRLTMHALWSTKNILSATHRKHVSISVQCMYVHMHGATWVRTTSHGAATDVSKFKLKLKYVYVRLIIACQFNYIFSVQCMYLSCACQLHAHVCMEV